MNQQVAKTILAQLQAKARDAFHAFMWAKERGAGNALAYRAKWVAADEAAADYEWQCRQKAA